ncbi:hypothetical protein B0O80DRAFT_72264 [Mortierella sp. GBAus27b]|nr:hypothetical protein B0O80DRAFT_72264 [Mortierella sp. GBAus27b]
MNLTSSLRHNWTQLDSLDYLSDRETPHSFTKPWMSTNTFILPKCPTTLHDSTNILTSMWRTQDHQPVFKRSPASTSPACMSSQSRCRNPRLPTSDIPSQWPFWQRGNDAFRAKDLTLAYSWRSYVLKIERLQSGLLMLPSGWVDWIRRIKDRRTLPRRTRRLKALVFGAFRNLALARGKCGWTASLARQTMELVAHYSIARRSISYTRV